ncbi:MAG TPA: hypothetical protein VHF50_08210 [Solirubrobacterales bacterium]|nr:hypothetical protein [Solirubrobacterales bacterium]
MDSKKAATFLAANRIAIGAALAAMPGLTTRGWIGAHAENPGARLMARAAGGRDVGIGGGILYALARSGKRRKRRAALRPWLEAAALADLVDMAATLAARRALSPTGLTLGVGIAGASAAAHLWLREELG